MKTKSPIFNVK